MIDVNVTLGRWPFRRLPLDETSRLVERLRASGVRQAWAGNLEAILHRDLRAANNWLSEQCERYGGGLLLPFGTVNPQLPDWMDDLRHCRELGMRGVRLYPNYHGYGLDDEHFVELIKEACRAKMLVQIVVRMEDERTHHPLVQVAPTDLRPLQQLLLANSELKLVLLNALKSPTLGQELLEQLLATGQVYLELAMLEGVGALETVLRWVSHERILFGTHAPLFYIESAKLKLRESELAHFQLAAIRETNAAQLIAQL